MKRSSKGKSPELPEDSPEYWRQKSELQEKGIRLFTQTVYRDWCKACGICVAFCPARTYDRDEGGKPVVARPDACTGCLFCEYHCPDFAITIAERYPDRRREVK